MPKLRSFIVRGSHLYQVVSCNPYASVGSTENDSVTFVNKFVSVYICKRDLDHLFSSLPISSSTVACTAPVYSCRCAVTFAPKSLRNRSCGLLPESICAFWAPSTTGYVKSHGRCFYYPYKCLSIEPVSVLLLCCLSEL